MRYTKCNLPVKVVKCNINCVYNENGYCDDVRTNKGNSDATCHLWTNKHLLGKLRIANNEKTGLL